MRNVSFHGWILRQSRRRKYIYIYLIENFYEISLNINTYVNESHAS